MESPRHVQNNKTISARGIAVLMVGTVTAFLLIAQKVAMSGKNTSAYAEKQKLDQFHKVVSPILEKHCYECHGDGAHKADIEFDALTTNDQILHNPQLWLKVL